MTATLLEVDGERFLVEEDSQHPGQYNYSWLSGRNIGYGFAELASDGSAPGVQDMVTAIRDFLRHIDPNTGYLE